MLQGCRFDVCSARNCKVNLLCSFALLTFLCRWFQPLLGFVMANLAKEAVEGMQVKLQQLQEKGEFTPEKATTPERAAAV